MEKGKLEGRMVVLLCIWINEAQHCFVQQNLSRKVTIDKIKYAAANNYETII